MADIQAPEEVYDIIIVGGGPGGLTAGLYASRANQKVLLLEGSSTVSQISLTDFIENYPGIQGISGFDLIDQFKKQAVGFGLRIRPEQVNTITRELSGDMAIWKLRTDTGEYRSLSVIISTGAQWRHLGVPGEEDFIGRGVSFCATCDAPFYKNREVAVVGGGNTAIQEALYLTKFASRVTVIHRRNRLRAAGILQERALANDKIHFAWGSVVEKIIGYNSVTGVKIKNVNISGETREIPVEGIFLFIGLMPNTKLVEELVSRDKDGYIIAHGDMRTSAEGMFACGDCIHKALRQVITACGDGATAASSAELYVDELKGEAY